MAEFIYKATLAGKGCVQILQILLSKTVKESVKTVKDCTGEHKTAEVKWHVAHSLESAAT